MHHFRNLIHFLPVILTTPKSQKKKKKRFSLFFMKFPTGQLALGNGLYSGTCCKHCFKHYHGVNEKKKKFFWFGEWAFFFNLKQMKE